MMEGENLLLQVVLCGTYTQNQTEHTNQKDINWQSMPGIEGTGDPTMIELPKAMAIVLCASCPSAVVSLGEVVYGGTSKQRPGDKEGSGL